MKDNKNIKNKEDKMIFELDKTIGKFKAIPMMNSTVYDSQIMISNLNKPFIMIKPANDDSNLDFSATAMKYTNYETPMINYLINQNDFYNYSKVTTECINYMKYDNDVSNKEILCSRFYYLFNLLCNNFCDILLNDEISKILESVDIDLSSIFIEFINCKNINISHIFFDICDIAQLVYNADYIEKAIIELDLKNKISIYSNQLSLCLYNNFHKILSIATLQKYNNIYKEYKITTSAFLNVILKESTPLFVKLRDSLIDIFSVIISELYNTNKVNYFINNKDRR